MASGQKLDGWGEIAGYLRVAVRTAQMYERDHALPVQRMPGPRGRVFAYSEDIETWLAAGGSRAKEPAVESGGERDASVANRVDAANRPVPAPAAWRKVYLAALAVALLGATAWAVYYLTRTVPVPGGIDILGNALIVKDVQGRELWRHEFPHRLHPAYNLPGYAERMWFASDVDGDAETELVFAHVSDALPENEGARINEVLCFSLNGRRIKWRFQPGRRKVIDNNGAEYFPPYTPSIVKLVPGRSPRDARIVISSQHHQEFPNQVAVLDGSGRLVGEYWHPGHLTIVTFAKLNGDSRQKLLLAGVNNAQHSATLVVFDVDRVHGTSTELANPRLGLQGLAPGTEEAVILFPRTCLVLEGPREEPYNRVVGLKVTDDRLELVVTPSIHPDDPRGLLYNLDYGLRVRSVVALPAFQQSHRELERAGVLKHSLYPDEIKQIAEEVIVRRRPAAAPASGDGR